MVKQVRIIFQHVSLKILLSSLLKEITIHCFFPFLENSVSYCIGKKHDHNQMYFLKIHLVYLNKFRLTLTKDLLPF